MCRHTTEMFPDHEDFGRHPPSWNLKEKRKFATEVSYWLWEDWGDNWRDNARSIMAKGRRLKAYSVVRAIRWYMTPPINCDYPERVQRIANRWLERQEAKCLNT